MERGFIVVQIYSFYPCSGAKYSSHEESSSDIEDEPFRVIEYYKDNPKLPVYTKKKEVLGPLAVFKLLRSVGTSLLISVACLQQPAHVENHRTFIVDIETLKSIEDLKFDDVGSWLNNSNKKFYFVVDKEGDVSQIKVTERNVLNDEVLTLKRVYFCLNDEIKNDFRKRIDIIYGKMFLSIDNV